MHPELHLNETFRETSLSVSTPAPTYVVDFTGQARLETYREHGNIL